MRTDNIKNLQDLRQAKRELKHKMELQNREIKNNFLFSSAERLASRLEHIPVPPQTPVGKGVSQAMGFINDQIDDRLQPSKTVKGIISIALVIAAPIVAKKVQEFIDDHF